MRFCSLRMFRSARLFLCSHAQQKCLQRKLEKIAAYAWNYRNGPGRTSVKSCLFNKKICHHIGFARATDLFDIFKNERNAPNVQRYRQLKLPSSGPRQNATKYQKSF